jgi:hypothetical protein
VPVAVNASSPPHAKAPAAGSGSAIVNEFKKYIGHKYFFGGYFFDPAGWDCSSAVSWVLQQVGITPPGGHYDGRSHGPATGQYMIWSGAKTVPHSQMQAGDYAVYADHIAIVTTPGNGISAEDPANGTREAPLSSGPGPYVVRRIKQVATANGGPSGGGGGSSLNPLAALQNSLPNLVGDLINGTLSSIDPNGLVDFIERAALVLLGLVFILIGVVKVANN